MRLLPWRAPGPARDITDRAVIERMASGDHAAVRELLARYRSTVYATAYAVLVDPEQVDAVVAGTFEQAWRNAARFLCTHGSATSKNSRSEIKTRSPRSKGIEAAAKVRPCVVLSTNAISSGWALIRRAAAGRAAARISSMKMW